MRSSPLAGAFGTLMLVLVPVSFGSCSGNSGGAGAGGISGSGGRGAGGAPGTGGTPGTGGRSGSGGAGTGGMNGSGGVTANTGGVGAGGAAGTGGRPGTGGAGAGGASSITYDQTVLTDHPVAFWAMNRGPTTEPDLTGNSNTGTYRGGAPTLVGMPNGDQSVDFNGSTQYLTVPSNGAFSIPTTGNLTWEAWIRPDVLQFPNDGGGGYVDWMGKCAEYAPTCEWEARMYDTTNAEGRCNRLSAYVFNPGAGLGSGADWQPTCGLFQVGRWYHVVGEYTTLTQPASCANATMFPGSISIWVNGVAWSQASHNPTGCISQYSVVPRANGSALNIGTMALDTWFQGAIGKVAIYDSLLTQAQITNHYRVMTTLQPSGSCGNTCSLP